MKIVADACTVILLSKATVFETAARTHEITLSETVYEEVVAGKSKKLLDALISEKLVKEKIVVLAGVKNSRLRHSLMQDFNMGIGEADTIALAMEGGFDAVATDNKQGRKAASVNSLSLVGSPEIVMALFKTKKINKIKAIQSLKVLKNEGWFNEVLIEKLLEEVDQND